MDKRQCISEDTQQMKRNAEIYTLKNEDSLSDTTEEVPWIRKTILRNLQTSVGFVTTKKRTQRVTGDWSEKHYFLNLYKRICECEEPLEGGSSRSRHSYKCFSKAVVLRPNPQTNQTVQHLLHT